MPCFGKKKKEDVEKEEEEERIPRVGGVVKFVRYYSTKTDLFIYIIGAIFAVGGGLGMPAFSIMFKDIIDSMNAGTTEAIVKGVNDAALFGFATGLIEMVIYWAFTTCFMRSGERLLTRSRQSIFEKVVLMELAWFEKHKPGTVSSYLNSDLLKVKEALGEKMGMMICNLSTFVFSIAYGFYVSWRLTLVIMAMFPLLILSGVMAQVVLQRLTTEGDKAYGKANDVTTEILGAIRTIAAFNGFERAKERYAVALKPSTDANRKKAWIQGVSFGLVFLILYSAYAIAFYYGSFLIEWKINTGGEVVGAFFSVLIGAFMLGSAVPHTSVLAEFRAVTDKVFHTVERIPPIQLNNPNAPQFPVVGRIEFRGITFRYPSRPEQLIFKKLSLNVEPGTKLALVGNSGSGKSSLLSLVERMYDPEEGDLYVDGHRLRDLDLSWWRDNVGIVMQEPVLFSGTIKENIRMGSRAPVSDEQIIEACKKANIYDTIMGLPETFETQVGDGGSQLSGGQRQRICIARAIVKNPKILLLDEATSALDRGSEMIVQKALDSAMQGRTTLIIAHRLVTIRNADVICFIKPPVRMTTAAEMAQMEAEKNNTSAFDVRLGSGLSLQEPHFAQLAPPGDYDLENAAWSTIAEMGSHDQLLANNGPYAAMVNAQAAAEKSAPHPEEEHHHAEGPIVFNTNGGHIRTPPATPFNGSPSPASKFPANYQGPVGMYENGETSGYPQALPHPSDPYAAQIQGGVFGTPTGVPHDVFVQPIAPGQPTHPGANEKKKKGKKGKKSDEPRDPEEPDTSKASLSRVAKMNLPEWGWLLTGLIGAIAGAFVYPVYSILLTEMTASFFKPTKEMREDIPLWCGCFVIIGVVSCTGTIMKTVGFGVAGARLTERIRLQLYGAFLRQEIGFFDHKKNDSGALANVLSGDTSKVHMLFGPTFGSHVQNIFTLGAGLIVAFISSWKLTLVILAAVPLMAVAGALNMSMMSGMDKSSNLYDQANQVVVESVGGIKTVMAINLQTYQANRYKTYMESIFRTCQRKALVSGFFAGITQLIVFGTFALAFWYGGQLIKDGSEDFASVMKAAMAMLMSAMGMGETNAQAGLASDAKQATARVFHYIDRVPKIDMDAQGHEFNHPRGAVTLEDVVFRYPSRPDTTILKKVSLEIEPGTQLALIGSTGCGKSTIIQMLERFYDPADGRVLVDGVPVKDLQLKAWREHIGLVGQEPTLFDDTVEYNIKFGKPTASDEEMYEAARVAQIHDVIMRLPEGYKTKVGLKGAAMSGGQRQRIAIARAVIKKPTLLLLDEATAALDNVSEVEVQRALDNVIQTMKMTVVTVAHRLTTIANVDKIAVLHQGHVIEHGSHAELYALNGEYTARYDAYHGTGGAAGF